MKDCRAEGVPDNEIAQYNWFVRILKEAPELRKLTMASGSRRHARLNHHKLALADKLAYYAKSKRAMGVAPTCNSMIIDKMHGNKNKLPRRAFDLLPAKLSRNCKKAMCVQYT
eukprot:5364796-Pleurochrysis_carterae.AAC.1